MRSTVSQPRISDVWQQYGGYLARRKTDGPRRSVSHRVLVMRLLRQFFKEPVAVLVDGALAVRQRAGASSQTAHQQVRTLGFFLFSSDRGIAVLLGLGFSLTVYFPLATHVMFSDAASQ